MRKIFFVIMLSTSSCLLGMDASNYNSARELLVAAIRANNIAQVDGVLRTLDPQARMNILGIGLAGGYLQLAAVNNNVTIVRMLIDAGARPDQYPTLITDLRNSALNIADGVEAAVKARQEIIDLLKRNGATDRGAAPESSSFGKSPAQKKAAAARKAQKAPYSRPKYSGGPAYPPSFSFKPQAAPAAPRSFPFTPEPAPAAPVNATPFYQPSFPVSVSPQQQLINAVRAGEANKVDLLVHAGVDPNIMDPNFQMPIIFVAIRNGALGLAVLQVLANDVHTDPNIRGKYAETPLLAATMLNNYEAVVALLSNPKTLIDAVDSKGDSALAIAQRNPALAQIARYLLYKGATPPQQNVPPAQASGKPNDGRPDVQVEAYKLIGVRPYASAQEILGLPSRFEPSELRKAYKDKSVKWHPDRNENSEQANTAFQLIKWAYDSLSSQR